MRTLLQQNNTPPSPSVDVFTQPNDRVCCCSGSNQYLPYQDTAPVGCCCGTVSQCCPASSYGLVCGSGQVCGILLLMSALVGTLVVTICLTGIFLARRRRMRNSALEQVIRSSQLRQSSSQFQRPGVQMVQISSDQLQDLYIAPPKEVEEGTATECPICLDSVNVNPETWASFPCGHGCCKPCLGDLLHHSSRRVNRSTVAVLCPLCRKLAVAPADGSDAPAAAVGIEVLDVEDNGAPNETATSAAYEETESAVPVRAVQESTNSIEERTSHATEQVVQRQTNVGDGVQHLAAIAPGIWYNRSQT